MKKPTITITPVPGGINVGIICPHGNAYDRTGPEGMHCSKEGCQCDIDNKKVGTELSKMFPEFSQFLR